ncbi:hypothetical protein [Streptomyces yanii]|uniref:Uncharacterized protein n=1 Tax=Streptomyces yanii TaxID=78510 RepID=A0ABV5RIY7_9ACTN
MTTEQHDVPADLIAIEAALGRMVYRAGALETVVRFTGESLAATTNERDELAGTTAGTVLRLTKDIASRSPDVTAEDLAELIVIFDEIRPTLDSRNVYIHGGWVRSKDQLIVMNKRKNVTANEKKGVKAEKYLVQTRPVAVKELNELADALLDLSNRVFDWTAQVLGRKHPELYPSGGDE